MAISLSLPATIPTTSPRRYSSRCSTISISSRAARECEVALRIASEPGNKAYGILSVLIQAWYDVEYLFTVDETVFNPPPKVKSAVIRMTRNEVTDLGCDERLFKRVVKTVFNQRRKMLRVSLRQIFGGSASPEFYAQDIMTKRPEQLSVQQFVELTNMVAEEAEKIGKTL